MKKFYKLVSENEFDGRQTRNRIIREEADKEEIIKLIEDNPTRKKLESIAKKHGFIIKKGYILNKRILLNIHPIDRKIKSFNLNFDSDTEEFYVNIGGTGEMNFEEFKEFYEKVKNIYEMLDEINDLSLSQLSEVNREQALIYKQM